MRGPFLTGKVEVEVTQRCIAGAAVALNGRLPRECNCPVALALDVAGFECPRVGFGTFTAGPGLAAAVDRRRRYKLPGEVATFIEHYDDGVEVAPFAFVVDADDYTEVEGRNDYASLHGGSDGHA